MGRGWGWGPRAGLYSPRTPDRGGRTAMPQAPLAGLRVLELGEFVSAAYCTRLLADLGAEVLKVEPPEGDRARRYGPYRGGVPDPEASGLFLYLNQGKQLVTLDLATAE